jgi:hypothetical protein
VTDVESRLHQIYELKFRLLCLGYNAFQVDEMFREAIGNAIPEEISVEDCENLITALERHIKTKAPSSL